jgi:SAM-dependent methyltransferase
MKLRFLVALALLASNSTPAKTGTTTTTTTTASAPASVAPSASVAVVTSSSSSAATPPPPPQLVPLDALEKEAKAEWDKNQHVDIVYVPTPQKVVDKMLEVAKVTATDVVYDLGCGDGRIVVTSAKKGAKATGFDIDPNRVMEARTHVKSANVEANASIRWANVFSVDLSPASVVTLYLLPELNVKLIPQLEKLKAGSRIVSHDFDMAGVKPDAEFTITAPEFVNEEGYSAYKGEGVPEDTQHYKQRTHHIYLWTTPLKKVPIAKTLH